jgi:hypothetical protein
MSLAARDRDSSQEYARHHRIVYYETKPDHQIELTLQRLERSSSRAPRSFPLHLGSLETAAVTPLPVTLLQEYPRETGNN